MRTVRTAYALQTDALLLIVVWMSLTWFSGAPTSKVYNCKSNNNLLFAKKNQIFFRNFALSNHLL